jgi:hypothetical protein
MVVTYISTVRHNVGDDFVRDGLSYLIKKALKNDSIRFETIHKHAPITSRIGFGGLKRGKTLQKLDDWLPLNFTGDRILKADWVVQSGAPIYWCHESVNAHCCDNEWFHALIRRRLAKSSAAFLNVAGGSCQSFPSEGHEFCPRCKSYIRELFASARITTLRDCVAKNILKSAGHDAPVLPCTSLFAVDEYSMKNNGQDYVVVNFMPRGAHHTFGQAIDQKKWLEKFSRFYFQLKRLERVIFSCHNREEYDRAHLIDPQAELFFSASQSARYLDFYSRAKLGIFNRVHGAMALASLGKPALVVGGDTRTRMLEEIGLPVLFVNEADTPALMNGYEEPLRLIKTFPEHISSIKAQAFNDYVNILAG